MFNLLITLIILIVSLSEAFYSQDIFERNPDESKYCPSALLSASHNKTIKGQLSFYQDSKGAIWLTGVYQWGFQNPDEWHYSFTIQNGCQEVIYDLTEDLQTEFAKSSGCDGYNEPIEEPPIEVVTTRVVTETTVVTETIEVTQTKEHPPVPPHKTKVKPPKVYKTPVPPHKTKEVKPPKVHKTPVPKPPKEHKTKEVKPPKKHKTKDVKPPKEHKTKDVKPPKEHKSKDSKPPKENKSKNVKPPKDDKSKNVKPPKDDKSKNVNPSKNDKSTHNSPSKNENKKNDKSNNKPSNKVSSHNSHRKRDHIARRGDDDNDSKCLIGPYGTKPWVVKIDKLTWNCGDGNGYIIIW
ncbi:4537_t:CDS:2 [Gigaspora rosea]|nr:4537_t:CDS:2 [Gigaspora rosea]